MSSWRFIALPIGSAALTMIFAGVSIEVVNAAMVRLSSGKVPVGLFETGISIPSMDSPVTTSVISVA